MRGFAMHATDGDMGAVDDFIVDDESWVLRSMVMDACVGSVLKVEMTA